jgi:hypothetical protein
MLPKFAVAGLAATAVIAATALIPTAASACGRGGGANWPQYGTWNFPAYTEMNCGYVRVNAYRQRQPGNGQWVYQCR